MKTCCLIVVSITLLNFRNSEAQNISGNFDEYQIGAWAMTQHNAICQKVYLSFKTGKVKSNFANNNAIMNYFGEEKYVHDTLTGPEPYISITTTKVYPKTHEYRFISMVKGKFTFQIDEKTPIIEILSGFENALSDEELNYIQMFTVHERAYFDSIPSISKHVLISLNLQLHDEASRQLSKTYTDDTLNKLLPYEQKSSKGNLEVVVFIQTQADDPTIGIDSMYTVPYNIQIKDSTHYLGLAYVLSAKEMTFTLAALSSTFEVVGSSNTFYLMPYGYVKIGEIASLTLTEMQFIKYCIKFSMNGKLKYNDEILNNYLKTFNIQPVLYNRMLFDGLIIEDEEIINFDPAKKQ